MIVLNLFLLYIIQFKTKEQQIYATKINDELVNSYHFTDLVLDKANCFNELILPDSLIGKFMLYLPETSCTTCIDSALMVLEEFTKNESRFSYFIATSGVNTFLKDYMRYKGINRVVYSKDKFSGYIKETNFPILTYYGNDKEFLYIMPIYKDDVVPFKNCLKRLFSN